MIATIGDALRLHLAHDDLTKYNAVQKLLYVGVMCVGILTVLSGLAIWKPIQFSELAALFGDFQTARLVHFLCMAAIVLFLVVHVTLALLVPRSLVAMITGGPMIDEPSRKPQQPATETLRMRGARMTIRTPSRSIFRPRNVPSQDILRDNRRLIQEIDRRNVLRGARQPRRADIPHRLQCQRSRPSADDVARSVQLERQSPVVDFPARSSRADLQRGAGRQAAALQRTL